MLFLNHSAPKADYGFIQKVIPVIGFIGLVSHIPFYFLLTSGFGYHDSLLIRVLLSMAAGGFIFFPRNISLSLFHKVYFEAVVAFALPFAFTLFYLMNNGNTYWFASVGFAGMAYGLMAQVTIYPWAYPLSAFLSSLVFFHLHPDSGTLIHESLKAQVVGYFSGFLSNAIKSAFENSHYRILEEREKGLQTKLALELSQKETDQARRSAEDSRQHAETLKRIVETLQSYTRPSLAAYIEKGEDPRLVLPSEKDLTVMQCDMRGFTALTERMEPQEQIKMLNSYFSMMTDAVERHGGEMDKFIGDAFMAIFESPEKAGFAAMDCRRGLQTYNKFMLKSRPDFQIIQNGIGIARGTVTHGNIGSLKKLDLTVVGAAANISARLESLTKKYNVDILVTEEIVNAMGGYPHSRWVDQVKVRGSSQGIRIYELYGHQADEVVKHKDETKGLLEKALKIYFQRGFRDAERMFSGLLEMSPPHRLLPDEPMDRIYLFYLMRCERNRKDVQAYEKLLQDWDGFHEFAE